MLAGSSRRYASSMASIEVPISDEAILDYLRKERGLQEGKTFVIGVSVEPQPMGSNSNISHVVKVELSYGLELGQLRALADF